MKAKAQAKVPATMKAPEKFKEGSNKPERSFPAHPIEVTRFSKMRHTPHLKP